MPSNDGFRTSSTPLPRTGWRTGRERWLAGGYLFVGLLWWFNFVSTGGGWRLSLAVVWTILGVGMAFAARSSRRRRAEKLRQHTSGAKPEAAKVDDEISRARWYEWVSVLAILGGSESFSRKVLDAKSRIETPQRSVGPREQPDPCDGSVTETQPHRGK
jgi:hypothetical protein